MREVEVVCRAVMQSAASARQGGPSLLLIKFDCRLVDWLIGWLVGCRQYNSGLDIIVTRLRCVLEEEVLRVFSLEK